MGPHTRSARGWGRAIGCWLALLGPGCTKDEVKPEAPPRVGVLELPISHRAGDAEPASAARIEITPSALWLDGTELFALENGRLPAAERSGYDVPRLERALSGKRAVSFAVYAAVPYATLSRVVRAAREAGIEALSFKVRKPNATSQAGWLTIPRSHFVESAEVAAFDDGQLLPWDGFAAHWDDALAACQASARADCGYKPLAKADGGKLDMLLRVRGSGVALRFRQAGAAPAATPEAGGPGAKDERGKKKPKRRRGELLEGIGGAAPAAEDAPPEPSTEHIFTLRADQATAQPSPISGITQPVCGDVACPVAVEAEGMSMSGQVLGLLGAAFPDGTPAPIVAWVLPPKDG